MSNQKRKNTNVERTKKALRQDLDRDLKEIRDGSRRELSHPCRLYVRALTATEMAKPCGVPCLLGGYPVRTIVRKYKASRAVFVGADGFGFINVPNPESNTLNNGSSTGPFSDRAAISSSLATFTNSLITSVGSTLQVGVSQSAWVQSKFDIGTPAEDMSYRLVGMTIEIFPNDSFSNQNGTIYLLEAPNHAVLNGSASFDLQDLPNYPSVRILRGVQTGSQKDKIVVNWHPRESDQTNGASETRSFNDFAFKTSTGSGFPLAGAGATIPVNGLIIMVNGDAGTQFHATITSIWEMKGRECPGAKPRLVDSRGMDLIMNAIARKQIDGYVGEPLHVAESYMHEATDVAKRIASYGWKHRDGIISAASAAMKSIGGFL